MPRPKKKNINKKPAAPVTEPVPILYSSRTNFYEVAEILVKKIQDCLPPELITSDEINLLICELDNIVDALKVSMDREAMMDMMATEFGQGVIFGIVMSYMNSAGLAEGESESDELEGGDFQ